MLRGVRCLTPSQPHDPYMDVKIGACSCDGHHSRCQLGVIASSDDDTDRRGPGANRPAELLTNLWKSKRRDFLDANMALDVQRCASWKAGTIQLEKMAAFNRVKRWAGCMGGRRGVIREGSEKAKADFDAEDKTPERENENWPLLTHTAPRQTLESIVCGARRALCQRSTTWPR